MRFISSKPSRESTGATGGGRFGYMPYESISDILLQNNGKNGYLRVRSRNIKRVRLSFDPWQFDASILFAIGFVSGGASGMATKPERAAG